VVGHGASWLGVSRSGAARQARCVRAWQCRTLLWKARQARQGQSGPVSTRLVPGWRGKAGLGRLGAAGHGAALTGAVLQGRQGRAWRCATWQSLAVSGADWRGAARLARCVKARLCLAQFGMARSCKAGLSGALQGRLVEWRRREWRRHFFHPSVKEMRILATIKSRDGYAGLLAAMRMRAAALDASREEVSEIAGLPARYAGKLLSLVPLKRFGALSLGPMLGALGAMLVLVEDEEMVARLSRQITPRAIKAPDANDAILTKKRRKKRHYLKGSSDWGRMMRARALLKLTYRERRRIARAAARARWRNRKPGGSGQGKGAGTQPCQIPAPSP